VKNPFLFKAKQGNKMKKDIKDILANSGMSSAKNTDTRKFLLIPKDVEKKKEYSGYRLVDSSVVETYDFFGSIQYMFNETGKSKPQVFAVDREVVEKYSDHNVKLAPFMVKVYEDLDKAEKTEKAKAAKAKADKKVKEDGNKDS